ncbi:sensor domain-containing diguanylate cyclase [Uliginosibacterium sp. H3]|uniref:Sensor domain-containing diguanylate cyclase n=1 Tax=Uliginosibacterium silvisoli TaxID=3114758 RepID=A0ABU6K5A8_9RHOO|nr:sensor domain-containing diguanylate cyclase [Uliginosibacterium sp. H3]
MDALLSQLVTAVPRAGSTEELTRPLLELLGTVAGMESTYLTTIDLQASVQHVLYARNVGEMQIPEGLDVPWDDTLCKRSLDEGRTYTPDVADCWGDSAAARALGIRTYVSTPVRSQGGELLGTLCAASGVSRSLTPDTEKLLQLFSQLIGTWLERERLLLQLTETNARLATHALVDVLTGLLNRRAITDTLERALAQAKREDTCVLVGLIDMDGFKHINDTYGHQTGDLFLQETARRLRDTLRTMDSIGRLGGDEFGIVAPGPAENADLAAELLAARITAATTGKFRLKDVQFDYAGASVGVVYISPDTADADEAFRLADTEMYRIKRQRRAS